MTERPDTDGELIRLRAIEVAAKAYYLGYVQDEADDQEWCVNKEQHDAAVALRNALGLSR